MTLTASPEAPAAASSAGSGVLEIRHVSKAFPNVQALADVSLDVRPGEVLAFLGENGAGKSTLLKILNGDYQPDEGTLTIDGEQLQLRQPARSARSRHPRHLPGAGDHPRRRRGREHLRRRAAAARPLRRPAHAQPARRRRAGRVRLREGAAANAHGRRALLCPAPAGRDHARGQVEDAHPRARRAHLVADRRGGRPICSPWCGA